MVAGQLFMPSHDKWHSSTWALSWPHGIFLCACLCLNFPFLEERKSHQIRATSLGWPLCKELSLKSPCFLGFWWPDSSQRRGMGLQDGTAGVGFAAYMDGFMCSSSQPRAWRLHLSGEDWQVLLSILIKEADCCYFRLTHKAILQVLKNTFKPTLDWFTGVSSRQTLHNRKPFLLILMKGHRHF